MAKVHIEFVDAELNVVDDPVKGRPCVTVNMKLEGEELSCGQWALVDTGSDVTIVSSSLLLGLEDLDLRHAQASGQDGEVTGFLISGVDLTIVGFESPITVTVLTRDKILPVIDIVLGRDVLALYRMVYNPGSRECYLETRP